jgi:hypothetical protein
MTVATVPPAMSRTLPQWTVSPATSPDAARQEIPATMKRPAIVADRCTGLGRAGRPDRASVTGIRDTDLAGHHAAAVAATTAKTIPTTISHHATLRRSIR